MNHKQTEKKMNLLYFLLNAETSSIYVSSWSRDVVNLECSVKFFFLYFCVERKTCGFFERICRIVVNFFAKSISQTKVLLKFATSRFVRKMEKHSCFNLSNFFMQIFLFFANFRETGVYRLQLETPPNAQQLGNRLSLKKSVFTLF